MTFNTESALAVRNDDSNKKSESGGSPGLVVMGGDSCSEGHGFESQCCILGGHKKFSCFCCKNCNICVKRQKTKKRPMMAHS